MKLLRFAIIGAGEVGSAHARAFSRHPAADVVAVVDTDRARALGLAQEYDATPYGSADDLPWNECDAVVVAADTADHASLTVQALDAGCHVLCEGPPGLRAAQAEAMEDASRRSGRLLGYSSLYRHMTPIQREVPSLGELYLAQATWVRRRIARGWGPRGRVERQGGGVLMTLAPPVLDLSWWLLGCPVPVEFLATTSALVGRSSTVALERGEVDPSTFEGEDTVVATIRFEGGVSLTLHAAYAANTGADLAAKVTLFGASGGLEIPLLVGDRRPEDHPPSKHWEDNGFLWDATARRPYPPSIDEGFAATADNCVESIQGEQMLAMPASQGTTLQQMLDGIRESAAQRAGRRASA